MIDRTNSSGQDIVILDAAGVPMDAHFHIDGGSIVFHSRGGTKGAPNATNTQYADGLRLVLDRLEASSLPISGIWVDSSRVQHLPLTDRLVVSEEEARFGVPEIFRLASRRMQSVGSKAKPGAGGNSNKRLRIGLTTPITDTDLANITAGVRDVAPHQPTGPDAHGIGSPGVVGSDISLPSGRVWITSFWGFSPESEGYLGFTRDGDREWLLRQLELGDLVMIYATASNSTAEDERGKILGFLEVEPRRIRDTDRMSPDSRRWKVEAKVADRWTHALPVARAWRAIDMPSARTIAQETLRPGANYQLIASRGALLTPTESEAALGIRVRPVPVWGGIPLLGEELSKIYVPSRGFPMSFGRREIITADGEHFLYALLLSGDPSAILSEPAHELRGKAIVKIGLAKSPAERCAALNASFPPAGRLRWKLFLQSAPLANGQQALDAETALKRQFNVKFRSLGGEFFLCEERILAASFVV